MDTIPARLSENPASQRRFRRLPAYLVPYTTLARCSLGKEAAELQQQPMVDCKDIAETLLDCLRQTECMKQGKGAKECMNLTDDCRVYRNTYFECKRSQLDMRTRIRGMKQH